MFRRIRNLTQNFSMNFIAIWISLIFREFHQFRQFSKVHNKSLLRYHLIRIKLYSAPLRVLKIFDRGTFVYFGERGYKIILSTSLWAACVKHRKRTKYLRGNEFSTLFHTGRKLIWNFETKLKYLKLADLLTWPPTTLIIPYLCFYDFDDFI